MPPRITTPIKLCRKCRLEKPNNTDHFYKRTDRPGLMSRCKDCMKKKIKEWTRKNPERVQYNARTQRLKVICWTRKREEEFKKKQNGRCAVCNREKLLVPDHDHSKRIPRGLLCMSCNTAIGKFQDSEEVLLSAINYLKKYKD